MRDFDIRAALLRELAQLHADESDTLIVQEMGVWSGTARVDIAVINGELSGFELKSDRDTLTRLPKQAEIYSRVFDRMTLVVGNKLADRAVSLIPTWWGVVRASVDDRGSIHLQNMRDGARNVSYDPYLVAQLLWKIEALKLLDQHGLINGWRTRPIRDIHERLAKELSFDVLSCHVRSILKSRDNWLGNPIGNQGQMTI